MPREKPLSSRVGLRWHQAPAYLFASFLIYVGFLTFLPNPQTHFGWGWRWIYADGVTVQRCWGITFALLGVAKIVAVELRTKRARGFILLGMFVAYVGITAQVWKTTDSITPGVGIYSLVSIGVAWWLTFSYLFERSEVDRRQGA